MMAKPRLFVVLGNKGDGKSVLTSIIALDNIVNKFGIPMFSIDSAPTPEDYMHARPVTSLFPEKKQQIEENFTSLSTAPRGYSNVVYKPFFDSQFKEEGTSKYYQLSYADFKDLFNASKLDAIQSLSDLLDLQDSRASASMITQILANNRITSFTQALNSIPRSNERRGGSLLLDSTVDDDVVRLGPAFQNYLHTAMLIDVVGDYGFKNTNFLGDMVTHDFVTLRGKLALANADSPILIKYLININMFLDKILRDRIKFVSGIASEKKTAYLNHPYGALVKIDEADILAPRKKETYTKETVKNLVLKHRKDGISSIVATQDASNLDPALINQGDVVFTSRVTTEGNAAVFTEMGFKDQQIDILRGLRKEVRNSWNFKVCEWAMIINQRIQTFYPILPLSAFKVTS